VIVAADPRSTATMTGIPVPAMRSLTTFYHLAPEPPASRGMLHLDADRRGPIVNTAVITMVAPTYAPGRHLIASTVLGKDAGPGMQADVLRHAAAIYGVETTAWEDIAAYPIAGALPAMPPGAPLRKELALGGGLFIAGDHRDTASIQGALVSGRRAAAAAIDYLKTGGRG
jgi:hypothetical protein